MTTQNDAIKSMELVVASAIANATRDYSNDRPSKATDEHLKQARAAISAMYGVDPTVAAGDALIGKLKELADDAYGYDHSYETTFHRDVYEELTNAVATYESTRTTTKSAFETGEGQTDV